MYDDLVVISRGVMGFLGLLIGTAATAQLFTEDATSTHWMLAGGIWLGILSGWANMSNNSGGDRDEE